MVRAVYPGTFDPMTAGHLDLVRRAASIFDEVVVGVALSARKRPMFTLEERLAIVRQEVADIPNVSARGFDGLLCDLVRDCGARVIVRGARAVSDFDYEFQMAGMNRRLMPGAETVFLTPGLDYQFVSGTFVREIALMGGDVRGFVTPAVERALRAKVAMIRGR
ncbi:MAG: pantetheine-phosphate adenylyltransferase [Duodenibacillus sp.]|nr:pantetheine-phosphate adenylyltransferase [Duodenibacillus sp.]